MTPRDQTPEMILAQIEHDIASNRNLRDLPDDIAKALRQAANDVKVDLTERVLGDVAL